MTDLSPWRVEWFRLVRTRRWLILIAVFVFFGFAGPLSARYLAQLVESSTNTQQMQIIIAPPVPADGIDGFVSNAMLVGLIVSIAVAASACAIDANPSLAIFYRTRVRHYRTLLLPRVTIATGSVIGAYLVGLLIAWYETAVLIGPPSVVPMVVSALLGSVYLAFAVAVTALAGTMVRTTIGAVGISLAVVLLGPLLGEIPGVSPWLPTTLAGAPTALLRDTSWHHYTRALVAAVVLTAGLLVLASFNGDRREAG